MNQTWERFAAWWAEWAESESVADLELDAAARARVLAACRQHYDRGALTDELQAWLFAMARKASGGRSPAGLFIATAEDSSPADVATLAQRGDGHDARRPGHVPPWEYMDKARAVGGTFAEGVVYDDWLRQLCPAAACYQPSWDFTAWLAGGAKTSRVSGTTARWHHVGVPAGAPQAYWDR